MVQSGKRDPAIPEQRSGGDRAGHVVEAPAAEAGPAVVNAYLDFKRRSLI